jgi:CO dehydrogenase maturation factor
MGNEDLMTKIAVSGKGGVGKTTLTSLLSYIFAEDGARVYAVDADPSANLALALGFPRELTDRIVPIVEMDALILERTGARPGEYGGYFKLNPRVDDIPDRFSAVHRNIHLLVMGSVRGPGAGCVCPENVVLKSLVTHLLLSDREVVLLDMVAGLEHLGRGTAEAVDTMLVVVEPGRRSIDTARRIVELASGLGIQRIELVANKVRGPEDLESIQAHLGPRQLIGYLPYAPEAVEADLQGRAVYDIAPELVERVRQIADQLRPAKRHRVDAMMGKQGDGR